MISNWMEMAVSVVFMQASFFMIISELIQGLMIKEKLSILYL